MYDKITSNSDAVNNLNGDSILTPVLGRRLKTTDLISVSINGDATEQLPELCVRNNPTSPDSYGRRHLTVLH